MPSTKTTCIFLQQPPPQTHLTTNMHRTSLYLLRATRNVGAASIKARELHTTLPTCSIVSRTPSGSTSFVTSTPSTFIMTPKTTASATAAVAAATTRTSASSTAVAPHTCGNPCCDQRELQEYRKRVKDGKEADEFALALLVSTLALFLIFLYVSYRNL